MSKIKFDSNINTKFKVFPTFFVFKKSGFNHLSYMTHEYILVRYRQQGIP